MFEKYRPDLFFHRDNQFWTPAYNILSNKRVLELKWEFYEILPKL